MSQFTDFNSPQMKKTAIDLNKVFTILLYRWYIIVFSIALCLFGAFLQLRYTTPLYRATLSMKLEDEKPGQISDLFKYGRTTGKFDNFMKTEAEIIKSRQYAEKALDQLGVEYTFYVQGNFISSQIYPNPYFNINTLHVDSNYSGEKFVIEYVSPTSFRLREESEEKKSGSIYHVLTPVTFKGLVFTIMPPSGQHVFGSKFSPVICQKVTSEELSGGFAGGINVELEKGTSLIVLDFVHEVPQMASDYLNTFAKYYIARTIQDKSQAAQQTIDFIDKQLMEMAGKVEKNELALSDIKNKNNGLEIDQVATSQVDKLAEYESEKNLLMIKHDFINKLRKNVLESKKTPVQFIVYDKEDAENIPDLLTKYNELLLSRLSLLQKNTAESPVAMENEARIKEIRSLLLNTILNVEDKINAKLQFLNKKIDETNEILSSIPVRQRMLINIQRDFKVNEKVYSYLFEKKLETSISKSSITPNASIIEMASIPGSPISPDSKRFYTIAILLGLGIGLGFIAVTRILYQKIPDKETIENISNIRVLGVIRKLPSNSDEHVIQVYKEPKSTFSESLRSIRTGLSFISRGQEMKIICLTSTVSGEGKTFCTINLAASLTLLNKKVIIIGCDLRRPKVHLSFSNITNRIGISTYLIGRSTLEQVIQHTEYDNLDVITAGPTPPNPSELLQLPQMNQLLQTLKETYDYVLIDSAPVGLVTDSMALMELADINLYVIRAQYSRREFALIPDRLQNENKISNLYTILNAFDRSAMTYGSIYKNDYAGNYTSGGYYYGGYYGKGGYGYYGKKYRGSYYSGYVSDDDHEEHVTKFSAAYIKEQFTKNLNKFLELIKLREPMD